MAGLQEKSVSGLLADLGLTGFSGIAATIGSPNTKLAITVTPPAWAVLADGTILAAELATTSIAGLTTNSSSLHLWLDYASGGAQGTDYSPAWSVAATAPSANAIKIADITVASNHLTVVTMVGTGVQGLATQLNFAVTTPDFPSTTSWVQNTTGQDVIAYVNTSTLTQTHIYLNSTNSSTGAIDLTTQAPGTIIIPNTFYISFTYSAGTGSWTWQGKRTH